MSRALIAVLSLSLGITLGRILRRLLSGTAREDPVPASGRLIAGQTPTQIDSVSLPCTQVGRRRPRLLARPSIPPTRSTSPLCRLPALFPSCAAAWRALESLEPPRLRLFWDPLALALAGPAALQEALALAAPWPHPNDSDSGGGMTRGSAEAAALGKSGAYGHEHRRFCYSNVGVSCSLADQRCMLALLRTSWHALPGQLVAHAGLCPAAAALPTPRPCPTSELHEQTRVWWFDQQLLAALAGPAAPRQVGCRAHRLPAHASSTPGLCD